MAIKLNLPESTTTCQPLKKSFFQSFQPVFSSLAVDAEVHVVTVVQVESGRNSDRRDRDLDLGKPEASGCRKTNQDQAFPGIIVELI